MSRALLLVLAAGLVLPAAAEADGARLAPVEVAATDLADATGAVAPSAALGHVVFSRLVPATGRFELVAWSAGRALRVLPVGDRVVPFDADVGPGATGRATVTFSRCAGDGRLGFVLPSVDFTRATGCRPWILDLERADGRARRLRLAGSTGLSLTSPSVRGGSVAAVAGGSANARILLWRRMAQAPIRLRGGTPPRCPYRSCPVAPRTGVDALDLGPRSVAFVWRLTQPGSGAGPGLEVRTSSVTPAGAGRQVTSAQGYVSGACGFRQPLSPSAGAAGGVAFLLAQSPCDERQTTLAVQRERSPVVLGARPRGVLAYGAAFDGTRVFWLRGAPFARATDENETRAAVPCADAGASCRLVVSRTLPLKALTGR